MDITCSRCKVLRHTFPFSAGVMSLRHHLGMRLDVESIAGWDNKSRASERAID